MTEKNALRNIIPLELPKKDWIVLLKNMTTMSGTTRVFMTCSRRLFLTKDMSS
jgi:hypothetical protein